MNTYQKGQLVRTRATFKDAAGALGDPTIVICRFRAPGGVFTQYSYGVDAEVVRESLGMFHVDVDAATEGTWSYKWQSTGFLQATDEKSFRVLDSRF